MKSSKVFYSYIEMFSVGVTDGGLRTSCEEWIHRGDWGKVAQTAIHVPIQWCSRLYKAQTLGTVSDGRGGVLGGGGGGRGVGGSCKLRFMFLFSDVLVCTKHKHSGRWVMGEEGRVMGDGMVVGDGGHTSCDSCSFSCSYSVHVPILTFLSVQSTDNLGSEWQGGWEWGLALWLTGSSFWAIHLPVDNSVNHDTWIIRIYIYFLCDCTWYRRKRKEFRMHISSNRTFLIFLGLNDDYM